MSTKSKLTQNEKSLKVTTLRGFEDRPLRRFIEEKKDGSYIVHSNGRKIGWPPSYVFVYGEDVFARLELLYRQGNAEELRAEWLRCQRMVSEIYQADL